MEISSTNEEKWNENVSFLFQTVNYARLQSNPTFLKFGNKQLLYTTQKIKLPFLGLSTSILKEAISELYPTEEPLDKQLLDRYIEHCRGKREIPIVITDQKLPYLELYPWGTIMLELDDDYEDKISWDAKKGVKQAISKGVEVVELKTQNEWKEFLKIGKNLGMRKNLRAPFMTSDFFCRCFEEQEFVRLMGAYVRHKLIAGGMFFAAKKYIRYIRGATHEGYYDYFPTHLILWKTIEWGKTNGYKYFDLGGYHIGAKKGSDLWKINLFKNQWGDLFLRRRYVGAFLLDDKSWKLSGGIFKYLQYALSEGIFKTKDKKDFKECLEEIAKEKAKLERIKYEACRLLGVREEYLQSRATQLYCMWKKMKNTNKKDVGLSLNSLDLSELEKNYTRIVELTSKNLKTQEEHLTKALRRFAREMLLELLREDADGLRKYGTLDIRINSLVDKAERYDNPLKIMEDLKTRIRNHQGEKKQDLTMKIKKFSEKIEKNRYIEKRNESLDELLNDLHENNLYLTMNIRET